MKYCASIGLLIAAISIGIIYHKFRTLVEPAQLRDYDLNEYWGPGTVSDYASSDETVLQELRYSNEPIAELIQLLNGTQYVKPPLDGVNFEYGFNTNFLSEFVTYWRDDYLKRWPSREVLFNRMPHFTTNIQGLDIHYIHTRATYDVRKKTVLPILLIHGWPGSVREFYDFIPLLAQPNNELDVVFEVVAPSLPGYGWSQGPSRPGLGVAEMAVVLRNLMVRLGYERFYVQGGDWGSTLGGAVATLFPKQVIGYHSNMCNVLTPLSAVKALVAGLAPRRFVTHDTHLPFHFPAFEKFSYTLLESGYFHLQATKPDTIGTVLSQHPIALGVWFYEKFSTWTNMGYRSEPDGGWSKMDGEYRDAIFDNIMIYYLTRTITSASRLYTEAFTPARLQQRVDSVATPVPTGCARFKEDIMQHLDWQLEDKYTNIVHSTYHQQGGHFIAMEKPEMLYKDFSKFVRKLQHLGVWK